MIPPFPCVWTGEAFEPRRGFAAQCDKHFVIGETYQVEVAEERSAKSHRHYFSSVAEAWASLPEHLAERYPTPDHLRRHALIMTGFRDTTSIVCSSRAEALRFAAFIRPMDEYAVVAITGNIVTKHTAKTQKMRAMDKETFGKSKAAVLEYVADLIGTTPEILITSRAA